MNSIRKNISIYGPAAVFEIALGALTPVFSIWLTSMGASFFLTALILAGLGVGQIIGDVPAGLLASKIGDKKLMLLGTFLAFILTICMLVFHTLFTLTISIFLLGFINASFSLARQSYLTKVTKHENLGRAMNLLGLTLRVGLVIGPLSGSILIHYFGTYSILVYSIALYFVTTLILLLSKELEAEIEDVNIDTTLTFVQMFKENKAKFKLFGTFALFTSSIRKAREVLVPLWCISIGFTDSMVSLLFGISVLVEIVCGIWTTKNSDKVGVRRLGIMSLAIMTTGLAFLPFMFDVILVTIVSIFLGIGNGFSTGLLMTIGAKNANLTDRQKFLGVYRIFIDSGYAIGPGIMSLGNLVSLMLGSFISASYGIVALSILFTNREKF